MTRECDAIGCVTRTQMGRFLCTSHWYRVPVATRNIINARYRAGRKDFAFLSDLEYLKAVVDAIDGVAALEGRPGEVTSYHRLLATARRKAAATLPEA